ncbi:MAG: Preprotein translocase subunit YidC [Candidatus Peregrinibacteria bacterium GW2011_GWA2_38_36]|nr:MAG: Preprotein translocase subunit YidC [Candidatus Peregrinibacteria bacterium GW2011_GWA2_38_36]
MGKNILKNVIIFIVIFLGINLIFNAFTRDKASTSDTTNKSEVAITVDAQLAQEKLVTATIKNNTQAAITIKNDCPKEPLNVYKYNGTTWEQLNSEAKIDCGKLPELIIQPDKEQQIWYDKWNHALFGEIGKYKISLITTINSNEKTFESNEFEITQKGFFRIIWDSGFYHPIYNTMVFLINIMPFRDLGFAIILLTLIIRFLLFFPSHHAMKSQKKMQEVQPEIDRIKEKFKGDQQRIGQETMRIFKENKVSPFGGCLPILIQFPFLIAVFYVIQNGLNHDNAYMIYGFLQGFVSLDNINVMLLGILNLTEKNAYVLPVIIGGLQFLQMKLSFAKKPSKTGGEEKKRSETQSVNNMMLYFMPVMIAIFTASVPAGVGIYWGISTIFSIGQQLMINKAKTKSEPKVKVVYK